jgi:PAS domain S-box-containing protein
MLVAASVLVLYATTFFGGAESIGTALLVDTSTALLAGVAFAFGLGASIWAPEKPNFWLTFSAFGTLCLTIGVLILGTGGTSSPFIALWMIVSIFAGVFGAFGLLPLFIATIAYLIWQFTSGTLDREAIVTVVLAGELPLVASFLIWHTRTKSDTNGDKTVRRLTNELSQVSGKSEVVINAIADGVIALSPQGTIQLINPAAEQIVGWTRADALSLDYKSVLKLLDATDKEATPANDPVAQALNANKEVATNNLSLVTNSGKKILVSVIVSPVGQPGSGVIVVFRDITKEKHEERQQAEFISTAAHEMRTPVASIEGYLGLALNPETSQVDEKARGFIMKAHESVQHLGNLFQDLLDVSKAEDGRLKNNPKVIDVVAFTYDIVEGLKPKAEAKGLRYIFKPLPEGSEKAGERRLNPVFYVNVDNDHLREVISNLIENAIKYTPAGDVTIDIGGDTEHVVINVTDSGIGIPKEDQTHLFQKFYRVDNTDTREIGGTGLGLYLSRRLVEAMNGRVWVESEYKRGSTFYVELPRIDHEEATRLIEAASIQQERESATGTSQPELVPSPMPAPAAGISPPVSTPQPTIPTAPSQAPMPPPPANDVVYTNVPATAVAEQLQNIVRSTQPPPPQVPQPSPRTAIHPNTPLSSIEQDPAQYIRTRPDGVPIPPRTQNKP